MPPLAHCKALAEWSLQEGPLKKGPPAFLQQVLLGNMFLGIFQLGMERTSTLLQVQGVGLILGGCTPLPSPGVGRLMGGGDFTRLVWEGLWQWEGRGGASLF